MIGPPLLWRTRLPSLNKFVPSLRGVRIPSVAHDSNTGQCAECPHRGSFSDFEQRSHEVRFALWNGHRRRSTHPCWRNDIAAPVAQFVAHKLLRPSSRRPRNPKWYRLFKHQAEVEVAPLGSASKFKGLAPLPGCAVQQMDNKRERTRGNKWTQLALRSRSASRCTSPSG
jgi:hypothetical protein